MYLIFTQQLIHLSKQDYLSIKELCRIAKNLTNQAIYNIRQHYFAEGKYLNYKNNYELLKSSDNYRMFYSNMAQQILKKVDESFKSFFAIENNALKDCRLPCYLPKDGYATLVINLWRKTHTLAFGMKATFHLIYT